MTISPHALIIGGGIGGLATALALQRIGFQATVFERTPELREVGAGLSLWANAVKAIEKLGLAEALAAISVPERGGHIRTWQGETLSFSSIELEKRFGVALIAVHRADLLAILLQALQPGTVQLGTACVGFEQDGSRVTAHLANGGEVRGDFLVGADGIRSVVRSGLFGNAKPCYSGYTAWRGVTRFEGRSVAGFESWGCGQRFGYVPISGARVYWFATKNASEGEEAEPDGHKAELLRRFRGWHRPIEAVISATDDATILRNDIYDLKPLKRWGVGRITLLGDAAHAMTPNLGQGACQALEDAVILARSLQTANNVISALRIYEAQRISRTSLIVARSRLIGEVAQWQHPLACRIRNLGMKLMPASLMLKQIEGVVGYRI